MQWTAVLSVLACLASCDGLCTPLRLLTLDLDDTLFPCGQVVQRANAALALALNQCKAEPSLKIEAPAIQDVIREVRKAHSVAGGVPLAYTELRKRAIAAILDSPGPDVVDACFDAWLDERQAAANELLFEGVVEALQYVRSSHPNCVVGAVTNGRGDPRGMQRLAPCFDFCVSGEDADVWPERKPSPAIYEHALRRALSCVASDGSDSTVDLQAMFKASWVHIGDCLVNDVEASKAAGATTVWFDPPAGTADALATFSTASPEEEARRNIARREALEAGLVDERIDSMGALPAALERLLAIDASGGRGGSVQYSKRKSQSGREK